MDYKKTQRYVYNNNYQKKILAIKKHFEKLDTYSLL